MATSLTKAYVAAAAAASIMWLSLLAWYWTGGFPYDSTSGVWSALASDWSHGTLYRSVHSASGYGGTRYMPLFFVLHGTLMRLGAGPVAAGVTLEILSLAAFLLSIHSVLRALGVERFRAAAASLLPLGCVSVQLLSLAARGDLLASALVLFGFSLALRDRPGGAGVLWALAFATKLTALWAPAAFAIAVLLRGEKRAATRMLTAAGVCSLLVVAMMLIASHGRVLASFGVVDGGTTWKVMLSAPWLLLFAARLDPFFIALLAVAVVLLIRRLRRNGWDVISVWTAGAALSTVIIFASPGADYNHLIDLLAAALILIAVEAPRREAIAFLIVFAIAQAGSLALPDAPSAIHYFQSHGRPTSGSIARIRSRIRRPGEERPVLSQNPYLPVAWNEATEVSDPFSLRVLAKRDTRIATEFAGKVRSRHYRAVILMDWDGTLGPDLVAGRGPARELEERMLDFPAGFLTVLDANYRVTMIERPFIVLEPRS